MKRKFLYILICSILSQSCSIITFTQSEKRAKVEQSIQLSDDCKLTATGSIFMNFAGIIKTDFSPASFKIEYQDKLIYLDPIVIEDTTKADYIFITHAHSDHFSMADIEKLANSKTLIIGPKPVVKKLKDYQVKVAKVGEGFSINNFQCDVIASYNIKRGFFHSPLHPKSDKNVGYVLYCDSVKIYTAGDTDFIPEMSDLKNITVALVPIGVGKTAMNPVTAAEAVNVIKPLIAIPIHYELGNNEELGFRKLVDTKIEVKILTLYDK
ncbi:MBL fold metallo-hydrolase [Bacteroidota bacterium]